MGAWILSNDIYIRLHPKEKFEKIKNRMFKSAKEVHVKVYPIPKFLFKDRPKCVFCNAYAYFMLEDGSFICRKCLENLLNSTVKLEEYEDIKLPLNEETVRQLRFEFSFDEEKWYQIKGTNLVVRDWKRFLPKLKKALLNKTSLAIKGEYRRERKELIIYG